MNTTGPITLTPTGKSDLVPVASVEQLQADLAEARHYAREWERIANNYREERDRLLVALESGGRQVTHTRRNPDGTTELVEHEGPAPRGKAKRCKKVQR